MKIAVISTMCDLPWAGSEELWAAMVDEALADNLEVAVSIYRWPRAVPKVRALEHKGAKVLHRRRPHSRHIVNAVCQLMPSASFRELAALQPDVLCIAQGGTYDSLQLRQLVRFVRTISLPYVVICQANVSHFIPTDKQREAVLGFLSGATRVVFVSEDNRACAERQLAVSLPNARVVQNPVNLSDRSCASWPSLTPAYMASVARLEAASKGQDILFEALSAPAWNDRDWCLRLYGEGADLHYLRMLARHYGIAERVEFIGQVSDVRAIWSDNHLLVLPSRLEGTPLALVEAMLCGRPSVVTDVGGNAEWIEEAHVGFVAEAPTAVSFGAALDRAWAARAAWQTIGQQAHVRASLKYDTAPGKTLLTTVLDSIHAGHRGSQPMIVAKRRIQ